MMRKRQLTDAEIRAYRQLSRAARRLQIAQEAAAENRPWGDAEHQAAAYLDFVGGGGDSERWWWSKDFTEKQRVAVEAAIERLRGERR